MASFGQASPIEDAKLLKAKWCQMIRLLRIQVIGGKQLLKADLRLELKWRGFVQAGTAYDATKRSTLGQRRSRSSRRMRSKCMVGSNSVKSVETEDATTHTL